MILFSTHQAARSLFVLKNSIFQNRTTINWLNIVNSVIDTFNAEQFSCNFHLFFSKQKTNNVSHLYVLAIACNSCWLQSIEWISCRFVNSIFYHIHIRSINFFYHWLIYVEHSNHWGSSATYIYIYFSCWCWFNIRFKSFA